MGNFKLTFCEPSIINKKDVLQFKKEFKRANSKINGSNNLDNILFFRSWLAYCKKTKSGKLKNRVEDNTYLVYDNKKLIGCVQFRKGVTENLNNGAGHIGYSVRPSMRNKGYATQILAQSLEKCKNLGMQDIYISCNRINVPSAKCILKNGGILYKIEERANYTLDIYKIEL